MSYDESEVVGALGFRIDDGSDEDEPMEPLEGGDDFGKFEEDPELDDPENSFH
ncbi:MAG: hypothetical protein KBC06_00940 [Candidatus Pacebacteria bacterium]|nr:hypothetical protein [Candidatus Paceibacterota bacterium]